MKENELRIDNYVKETIENEIVQIASIIQVENEIFDFEVKDENGMFSNVQDEIEPIPLTEQWLLKFGFEKCEYSIPDLFINKKLRIKQDSRGFWISACYNFILIKHIHQLQNLYFVLTGDELTLK